MLFAGRLCAVGALVAAATFGGAGVAGAEQPAVSVLCPACGHNLILNPGAEAGVGTNEDTVVKVPDWKPAGGFTAAQYAWSGGDITATTPGPKNRGKNYFYGGPDALRSTGTQTMMVAAGGISAGKVTFTLSGWLGGFSSQGDNAQMYMTFENTTGTALGKVSLGPVTEGQRSGNSELLLRHVSGQVPAATRQVVVKLVMSRTSGSDNDGMADNLLLVFSEP